MKMCTYGLIALQILVTGLLFGQKKSTPTIVQVDSIFADWTNDKQPGIAVGILSDGEVAFNTSYGLANLEHGIPISDKTVFHFPGMNDQLIAFSVLLLDKREQLSLKQEIGAYIDVLPKALHEIPVGTLLHHNSGLQNLFSLLTLSGGEPEYSIDTDLQQSLLTYDEAYNGMESGDHQHNRTGMRLLQDLITEVSGMPWKEFVATEIFEPLNMNHSYIRQGNESIPNLAQGYIPSGDAFSLYSTQENKLIPDRLYTSAADMLKWVDNFWRPQIGSSDIWKKMDEYVLDEGSPVMEANQAMFVGQHRFWDYRGTDKYYQIGVTENYAAKMIRYPDQDLAIVVLGNFGRYNGHLATICSELYLTEYFEDSTPNDTPNYVPLALTEKQSLCGDYWDSVSESKASVRLRNDTLTYFEERYNWNVDLNPTSSETFFIDFRKGYDVSIKDGRLTLHIPNRDDVVFEKYVAAKLDKSYLKRFVGSFANATFGNQLQLLLEDEQLILRNQKERVVLRPLTEGVFYSDDPDFAKLHFVEDEQGEIVRLDISNYHIKDVAFKKVYVENQKINKS